MSAGFVALSLASGAFTFTAGVFLGRVVTAKAARPRFWSSIGAGLCLVVATVLLNMRG